MVDDAGWRRRTSYSMRSTSKCSWAWVRASIAAGPRSSEPSSHSVANGLSGEWNNGFGFVADGTGAAAGRSPVGPLVFAGPFAWASPFAVAVDAVAAAAVAADDKCCAVRRVVAVDSVLAEAWVDSARGRRKKLAVAAAAVAAG